MATQPESLLKQRVLADLKTLPRTYAVKIQQMTIRGTPDILACVNGMFVAIELKKSCRDRPDRLQSHNLKKITESGGLSFVVNPSNWPEVFSMLKEIAVTEYAV